LIRHPDHEESVMPSFNVAFVALVVCAALGADEARPRVDDRLLPAGLTDKQKTALGDFLASVKKPDRFIPESAKVVGAGSLTLDSNPVPNAEIKEYLASVVPYRTTGREKTPSKVEIYWYRPNPKAGAPGVTIRRVVDLTTGEEVGAPEVLFNHPTPLAREELIAAVRLARAKSDKAKAFLGDSEPDEFEFTPLVNQIKVTGAADGSPGDRVVNLQILKKSTGDRLSVNVNLTKESVRAPGAP
jgi:hypothetical protein